MSSSSSSRSQTLTTGFSSSTTLLSSSSLVSSVTVPGPASEPPPVPSPSPSISTNFVASSSSSAEPSSSLSSDLSSSSVQSVTSSQGSFGVASSIQTNLSTTSSSLLGTSLSESTSSVTHTLRPAEIAAIALGVVTAILGVIALLLFLFFRRRRHRHHSIYGLPYAKENKGMAVSSKRDLEARETPSGRSYFRSLSEQKGTTPLLQTSAPQSSDLSHEEPYRDLTASVPTLSFFQQETSYHPTTQAAPSIRPPRNAPPPVPQKDTQLVPLTIPEYIAPKSNLRSLQSPTQSTDALSNDALLAYEDENVDADRDSPSIYSQSSGHFRFSSYTSLSRGPSASSHYSMQQFYVPSTVFESPNTDSERHDVDTIREDNRRVSDETITPGNRGSVSSPRTYPVGPSLDFLNTDPHQSPNSGLERYNTTAVASLLKSRQQRQSELPPTSPSVSPIERAGSINPARSIAAGGLGVGRVGGENSGTAEREPYGRRFRRMKAEQGN